MSGTKYSAYFVIDREKSASCKQCNYVYLINSNTTNKQVSDRMYAHMKKYHSENYRSITMLNNDGQDAKKCSANKVRHPESRQSNSRIKCTNFNGDPPDNDFISPRGIHWRYVCDVDSFEALMQLRTNNSVTLREHKNKTTFYTCKANKKTHCNDEKRCPFGMIFREMSNNAGTTPTTKTKSSIIGRLYECRQHNHAVSNKANKLKLYDIPRSHSHSKFLLIFARKSVKIKN